VTLMSAPDGLWIAVEWTKDAAAKIKSKAYRYFSPEFVDSWKHPKTGEVFKDVLFGGGLTNRPFLKDILPVNLSEFVIGGTLVDPKEIAKLLGLPEDTPVEQLMSALAEKTKADPKPEPQPEPQPTPQPPPAPQAEPVAASEEKIRKLAETDPVVRSLMERIAGLEIENRTGSVNTKLSEINSGTSAIAPVLLDEVRQFALECPKALSEKFLGLLAKIVNKGIVQLGESTGGGTTKTTEYSGDAVKAFNDKVSEFMAKPENKDYTFADAMVAVSSLDEALFESYRQASYAKEQ
jgi:hypothetical protein